MNKLKAEQKFAILEGESICTSIQEEFSIKNKWTATKKHHKL